MFKVKSKRAFFVSTPAKAKHLLAGVLCVSIAFAVTFFLLRQMAINAQNSGVTVYLPLIIQPKFEALPDAQQDHIQWNSDEAPYPALSAQSVILDYFGQEYLFLLGGGEQFNPETGRVEQTGRVTRADLQENGELGSWTNVGELPSLPLDLHGFTATAVDNRIYVLGGLYNFSSSQGPFFNDTVFCAEVNEDGTFSNWEANGQSWVFDDEAENKFENSMAYHAAVYLDGHLYVMGGLRRGLYFEKRWTATKFVFSVEVGDSCGALVWQQEADLLTPVRGHSAVAYERAYDKITEHNIYLFGGLTNDKESPVAVSLRGEVENGEIISWTQQPIIPGSAGLHAGTAVRSDDYLYFIGGTNQYNPTEGGARSEVYQTQILSDGSLQPWNNVNSLDYLYGHTAVSSALGRIYVTGGARITEDMASPIIQNNIYWTPLLFFEKESDPEDIVYPGEEIEYRFIIKSNNVRDFHGLVISDTLPANLELVIAPNFNQNGQSLRSIPLTLPVNNQVWQSFTAVVTQPELPILNNTPTATATSTPTSTSTATATPTAVSTIQTPPIRPTDDKSCVLPEANPDSGTPRPKPTCTPTPIMTVSSTPTATATDTSAPPPTDTPTATSTPEPVTVINVAELCFEGQCYWSSTAVIAPNDIFLPGVEN